MEVDVPITVLGKIRFPASYVRLATPRPSALPCDLPLGCWFIALRACLVA